MPRQYKNMRYENNVDFYTPDVAGKYDIPIIKPEVYEETEFIPFSAAGSARNRAKKGIHFFIDDFHFFRLWYSKGNYEQMLTEFKAVMTPDFSMYTDWPVMIQMFNHYRKHVMGAWMQSIGCKVYPTICWSDEASYEWCFDGEPKHATVCVSSVGTQKSKHDSGLFLLGYDKMMEVLEPETVLFYGKVPKECSGNIVPIKAFYEKFDEGKEDDA